MRKTIRWLCRSFITTQWEDDKPLRTKECDYMWIAPDRDLSPKCPRCGGTNVVKLEEYFEKAPLQ